MSNIMRWIISIVAGIGIGYYVYYFLVHEAVLTVTISILTSIGCFFSFSSKNWGKGEKVNSLVFIFTLFSAYWGVIVPELNISHEIRSALWWLVVTTGWASSSTTFYFLQKHNRK